MAFSINSKLGELIANEATKAILEKHLPGMSNHPQLAMAKGMSLKMIAAFPQAGLTPDKLKAIDEELQKVL
jgi:hypothetical protein